MHIDVLHNNIFDLWLELVRNVNLFYVKLFNIYCLADLSILHMLLAFFGKNSCGTELVIPSMSKVSKVVPVESYPVGKLLAIGGSILVKDNHCFTIEQYDRALNTWNLLCKVPGFREEFGVEQIDDSHLILMGGRDERNLTLDQVMKLNIGLIYNLIILLTCIDIQRC